MLVQPAFCLGGCAGRMNQNLKFNKRVAVGGWGAGSPPGNGQFCDFLGKIDLLPLFGSKFCSIEGHMKELNC